MELKARKDRATHKRMKERDFAEVVEKHIYVVQIVVLGVKKYGLGGRCN